MELSTSLSLEPNGYLHAVNLYDSSKCVFDSSIIDSILTEFSKGHSNKKNYLNNEYKLITKEILSFNDLYQQEDIRIIYSKNFVVETDISFLFPKKTTRPQERRN